MVRLHTNNKCHDSTPLIMKKEKSFESVKNGKIYSILQFLKTYKKYSQKLLHVCNWKMKQGRNHWGPWGHEPPTSPSPPQLQFPNQTRSNSLSLKNQGYCFLRVFRNYTVQKFHYFYRVYYNFWTIYGGFSFFLTT